MSAGGDAPTTEELLEARRARLRRHNAILRALSQADAPDAAAQVKALTEAAAESLEVTRASVWLYGPDRRSIRCVDLYDASVGAHSEGTELHARDFGEYFTALEGERVIVAADAPAHPATRCFAESYLAPLGIASMLDAPIRVGGKVVGVLCHEQVGTRRDWSEDDEAVAGSMADFASAVFERQERRRAEEALRRHQEQASAERLEAVGRLAGGLAHDLNNILTAILSYANLVHEDLDASDPLREDVDEILQAGARASELTRRLLAFSRGQVMTPAPVDANALLADVEKVFVCNLDAGHVVDLELCPEPVWISADRAQLERALHAVLENAREALGDDGRILVRAQHAPCEAERERLLISVTDTGCGMSEEARARLFEPFFTTKGAGRSGLGLATAYGIVKQSGGEITIKSEEGRGTTVAIRLPTIDAPARNSHYKSRDDVSGTETILVVDDEAPLRTVASSTLTRYGYEVLVAADLDEAVAIAESFPRPIHLLVSDVVMPKASGWVVAEKIRELRPDVAVIFVSGYAEAPRRAADRIDAPVHAKPYRPRELASWVRAALDAAKSAGAKAAQE